MSVRLGRKSRVLLNRCDSVRRQKKTTGEQRDCCLFADTVIARHNSWMSRGGVENDLIRTSLKRGNKSQTAENKRGRTLERTLDERSSSRNERCPHFRRRRGGGVTRGVESKLKNARIRALIVDFHRISCVAARILELHANIYSSIFGASMLK